MIPSSNLKAFERRLQIFFFKKKKVLQPCFILSRSKQNNEEEKKERGTKKQGEQREPLSDDQDRSTGAFERDFVVRRCQECEPEPLAQRHCRLCQDPGFRVLQTLTPG